MNELLSQLGLGELFKFVEDIPTLNSSSANEMVQKILNAASKKGKAMLNKATSIISSFPVLAASPSLKSYLTKARQSAEANYNAVERKVDDLSSKANQAAEEINNQANKSILTKVYDDVKSIFQGKPSSSKDRAKDLMNSTLNKINDYESEV